MKGKFEMKTIILAAVAASLLVLGGCASTAPQNPDYNKVNQPVTPAKAVATIKYFPLDGQPYYSNQAVK